MQADETAAVVEEAAPVTKPPKVSVCVVTYNQEKYIAQCLQSIVDQETDFDFEIIVGDDCSTDGTREIVRGFAERYPGKFRVLFHPQNVGASLNYLKTHELARGEYVAHIDGDDYCLGNKLQVQFKYLESHPGCAITWGRMLILNDSTGELHEDMIGSKTVLNKLYTQGDLMAFGSIACHSSKMYRRTANINLTYPEGNFLDFYVNVCQLTNGYGVILKFFLGVYRSNVGVLQGSAVGIKNVFIDNLTFAAKLFPSNKDAASALFWKIFIYRLIKNKNFDDNLLKNAIENFGKRTPLFLWRSMYFSKYFRAPKLTSVS